MVFSSLVFLLYFLPLTLLGYYILNQKLRNIFLLLASLLFYAWGEIKFLPVMCVSILANYTFGLMVDKFRRKKTAAYAIIALMSAWNIGIFFIYKYLNFVIINVNNIFDSEIPLSDFTLPIGISFFTFQAMSYVIDVYRENGKVQKSPLNVALYITFFPQLIAGPIVRYETVANEIKIRKETLNDLLAGTKRFIVGLGKKVILSNAIAIPADRCFNLTDYSELSVLIAWFGAICYAFQILFDFSGYSDMAIGIGQMFGFHFNENFNYPYCASSVSDFWRRWHISLGLWFRDYVYFPLGGSRVRSRTRLVFNLFVVWLLTGIWHGASWNFVIWGLFYFALLVFEKLTGIPEKKELEVWQKALYRAFTLLCVVLGWVIFRAKGLKCGVSYLLSMFGISANGFASVEDIYILKSYIITLAVCVLFSMPVIRIIKNWCDKNKSYQVAYTTVEAIVLVAIALASVSSCVITSYDPFIYFNF